MLREMNEIILRDGRVFHKLITVFAQSSSQLGTEAAMPASMRASRAEAATPMFTSSGVSRPVMAANGHREARSLSDAAN